MKTAETAQPYEWDWDGAEIPTSRTPFWGTFSVGIFQWIPTKDGKRLKRSKVVKRIKGLTSNPKEVFQKAREECERRNREENK